MGPFIRLLLTRRSAQAGAFQLQMWLEHHVQLGVPDFIIARYTFSPAFYWLFASSCMAREATACACLARCLPEHHNCCQPLGTHIGVGVSPHLQCLRQHNRLLACHAGGYCGSPAHEHSSISAPADVP